MSSPLEEVDLDPTGNRVAEGGHSVKREKWRCCCIAAGASAKTEAEQTARSIAPFHRSSPGMDKLRPGVLVR